MGGNDHVIEPVNNLVAELAALEGPLWRTETLARLATVNQIRVASESIIDMEISEGRRLVAWADGSFHSLHSWAEIGAALNMTAQGAQQRAARRTA